MKKITLLTILFFGIIAYGQTFTVEAESFTTSGGTFDNANLKHFPDGDPGIDAPNTGVRREATIFDFTNNRDWIEFDISVATAGNYSITLNYSSPADDAGTDILIDGVSAGSLGLPNTGTWNDFEDVTAAFELPLTAGNHTLRLNVFDTSVWQFNLDIMTFEFQSALSVDYFKKQKLAIIYDATANKVLLPENLSYSLYNITGNLISSGESREISLDALFSGIYMIATDKGIAKIIKN